MAKPTTNNKATDSVQKVPTPTRFIPAGGPGGLFGSFWKRLANNTSAAAMERDYDHSAQLTSLPMSKR